VYSISYNKNGKTVNIRLTVKVCKHHVINEMCNCTLCVDDIDVQLETQSWFFDNTDKSTCEQKVFAVGQV